MKTFMSSLFSYLFLYANGFRIHVSDHSSSGIEYDIFRFFWDDKIITDMADISRLSFGGKETFTTVLKGSTNIIGTKAISNLKSPKYLILQVLLFLFVLWVLVVGLLNAYQGTMYVRAPELFGEGVAYTFNYGDRHITYIDAWGDWIMYGKYNDSRSDCRIIQIAGEPIKDAEEAVPCNMRFVKSHRFVGWIDFRGHTRPFCGAPEKETLPSKCYGE